jgi:hypothetical protein
MSLERRLTEALHQADSYQPSVDLFARLNRSIEEDRLHRRRMRKATLAVVVGLALVTAFVVRVAERGPDGALNLPKWSIQAVTGLVLTTVLLALGPAIRRYGQPFLADVFHSSPPAGERFSRLLDVAYYLFFGGGILQSLDFTEATALIPATGESVENAMGSIAIFLTLLGLVHAGNLLILPVVGLVFSSVTRNALRRDAGSDVPPISQRARKADRLAMGIVIGAGSLLVVGVLVLIALGFGLNL